MEKLNKKDCYFVILSNVILYIHEFFKNENFVFVDTNIVQKKYVDNLKNTIYFGKNNSLFLTPSNSLKLSALSSTFGNIYTVTHAFRNDLNDETHLSEFHLLEVEWNCGTLIEVENLLFHFINFLIQKFNNYLESNQITIINKKEIFKNFFPVYDFLKVDKLLGDSRGNVDEVSNILCKKTKIPIFLANLPTSFSWRAKKGFSGNLIFPRIGEIVEYSVREMSYEFYLKKFTFLKFADKMGWFLDAAKNNIEPKAGFGFGIDRFVMWLLDITDINDIFLNKESNFYECL